MLAVRRNLIVMMLIAAIFAGSTACADNFATKERSVSKKKSRKWKRNEVEGKAFFTTANMWYEKPNNFCSTNFHKGAIIPAGTKVVIDRCRGTKIKFTEVETGATYTYLHAKKHSRIKLEQLFYRYFTKDNPMSPGGAFSKFTAKEEENIKNGTINIGMSKEATIMAYGYPPTHKTVALENDVWTYWRARAGRIVVHFKDNKISYIEG